MTCYVSCKDIDAVIDIYESFLLPEPPNAPPYVGVYSNDSDIIIPQDKKEKNMNFAGSHRNIQKLSETKEDKVKIVEHLRKFLVQLNDLHATLQEISTENFKTTTNTYVDTYLSQLNELQTIMQKLSSEYVITTLTDTIKTEINSDVEKYLEVTQEYLEAKEHDYRLTERSKDEEKIATEQARKVEEERLAEELYLQVQDIAHYQEEATLVTLQGLVLDNPPHCYHIGN